MRCKVQNALRDRTGKRHQTTQMISLMMIEIKLKNGIVFPVRCPRSGYGLAIIDEQCIHPEVFESFFDTACYIFLLLS
jgi:hypothetical protein